MKSDFASFEELMEFVEREARRRIQKIRELKRDEERGYDELILKTFELVKGSISLNSLHILTGIPKSRLVKRLKQLAKFRKIRKTTEKRISFYDLNI
jgi:hypothetical protein